MVDENTFSYISPSSDAAKPEGSLAGIRVAVQPNLSVRGWPTRAGSLALENFNALEDATAVERLLSSGAHIAGYTRMAELGFGLHGDTSAAAVASSQCEAAVVTDTLGEARVTAAQTHLIGFKPTAGTVSRYGLIGLVPSMESLGVVARDTATICRIMEAISGPDERDFSLGGEFPDYTEPADGGALRRGVVLAESIAGLDPAEKEALETAITALSKSGVETREVKIEEYRLIRAVHQTIGATEASSSAGKYDSVRYGHRAAKSDNWNEMYLKSREESFGPLVKEYLFQGAYFQFKDFPAFENACRIRRRLVEALDAALQDSDVIILPTRRRAAATDQPEAVSHVYDRFELTLAANVAGLPAISLPGFVVTDGDDLGLQLISRPLQDNMLLGCAARLLTAHTEGE